MYSILSHREEIQPSPVSFPPIRSFPSQSTRLYKIIKLSGYHNADPIFLFPMYLFVCCFPQGSVPSSVCICNVMHMYAMCMYVMCMYICNVYICNVMCMYKCNVYVCNVYMYYVCM